MAGLIEVTVKHSGKKVLLNPDHVVSVGTGSSGDCVIVDSKCTDGEYYSVVESYENVRRAIDDAFLNPAIFPATYYKE